MAGLDKIIDQILEDAKSQAQGILTDANKQAEEIMQAAAEEGKSLEKEISEKAALAVNNAKERSVSSADLQKRRAILQAKQSMISDVIQKAYVRVKEQDVEPYFAMMEKMLEQAVCPQKGIIYFSRKDLERMPGGFEERAKAIAATKGGELEISKECRNQESGFILAYGGIEENCSFKALFDAKKDELQDQVHQLLFS